MKKSFIITAIIGIVFFVTIAYSMFAFNNTVNYELERSVRGTLADLADQQQINLNRQLENMIIDLSTIAETLPIIGVNEEELLEYVKEKQESLHIDSAMIVDNAGFAYLTTKEIDDVSDTDFFNAAMSGEAYATTGHVSKYSGKDVFTVAVPIYVDGKVDGVFAVEYTADYLTTLLTTFTDERGLNILLDDSANIMLSTNQFVISFDAFAEAEFEDGATFESVLMDLSDGKEGSISYSINGEKKFGEYRPIAIRNWSLFFEIPEESVVGSVSNISNSMLVISFVILFFALLTIIYIVISNNIAEKKLEKVAYYDELTDIPNLIKFKQRVSEIINSNQDLEYAMVKFDIVNFKAINEMFGFEEGNKVIKAIADTGKSVTDSSFVQARIGTDEFLLFADKNLFINLEESSKRYERLFKTLLPQLKDHQFSFRYGRYYLGKNETEIDDMVDKTFIAHSYAKLDNSKNIRDYDDSFTKKVLRDTEISNKMYPALENREYKVHLQPKYNVITQAIVGAEALVRWEESNGNKIFPNDFIPLFEQNGFIVELDKYMLKSVCEVLADWKSKGKELITISVNFSRLHIRNENFVSDLKQIVESFGIETKYIEIEFTESTVMENEKGFKILLNELHEAGFTASIDDFGSGYSSLGMLKNFKMDTIKLDRSFFVEMENEEEHERGNLVVESIVSLAGKLGIYTVAEGVEEESQEIFLRKINCDAAQGYIFAKPMPIAEFEEKYT